MGWNGARRDELALRQDVDFVSVVLSGLVWFKYKSHCKSPDFGLRRFESARPQKHYTNLKQHTLVFGGGGSQ